MHAPTGPNEPVESAEHAGTQATEYGVPFESYSQMDPKWDFEPGTERSMCGVICTKALIDHHAYMIGGDGPPAKQILAEAKSKHEWDASVGIGHHVEVDILKDNDMVAWRRNWDAPSSDPQWLIENEGYDQEQVAALTAQQAAEAAIPDVEGKMRQAILDSLRNQNPVIASVSAGFGDNAASHQVVITGWRRDGDQEFYKFMDPERAPGHNNVEKSAEHFFSHSNHKAIFAKPGKAPGY